MKHFFIAAALAAIAASASAAPVNSQFHHQIPMSAPQPEHQHAANAHAHWMSALQHPPPTPEQLRQAAVAYRDLALSHAQANHEAIGAAGRTRYVHWLPTAHWHHTQCESALKNQILLSSAAHGGTVPHNWNAHNILHRTERVEAAEKEVWNLIHDARNA